MAIVKIVFALLLSLASFHETRAACPDFWTAWEGNCYRFFDCAVEWTFAEAECQIASPLGHLASIHSDEENNFVFGLQGGSHNIWIGLNDRAEKDVYVWSDNTEFGYFTWQPGEPNNSCGLFCEERCVEQTLGDFVGRWNDQDCSSNRRYVCKMPDIPVTD
ncbi:C-type lectin lectoxin-Thr1-like [Glandiceps talaboti]